MKSHFFEQEVSIGPGVYTLSGNLLNSSSFPLGDGRRTILKAEIVAAGTVWWTQEAFINEYSARDTWHNVSMVIDNSVAGADTVKIVLMQWDDYGWMGMGFGNSYFDNIALVDCGGCMRASGDLNYDWDVDWLDVSIMTGDWLEDLSTPP